MMFVGDKSGSTILIIFFLLVIFSKYFKLHNDNLADKHRKKSRGRKSGKVRKKFKKHYEIISSEPIDAKDLNIGVNLGKK